MKSLIRIAGAGFLAALLLLSACGSPLDPPAAAAGSPAVGEGVLVKIAPLGGARTLYPDENGITKYVLTFTSEDYEPVVKTVPRGDSEVLVQLEGSGDYTIRAGAYVSAGGRDRLVASGEVQQNINVENGSPNTITITLDEIGADPGIFSYEVSYPPGISAGSFSLSRLNADGEFEALWEYSLLNRPSPFASNLSLDPGYYRVNLSVTAGAAGAGRSDIVYIAPNLVTRAGAAEGYAISAEDLVNPPNLVYAGLAALAAEVSEAVSNGYTPPSNPKFPVALKLSGVDLNDGYQNPPDIPDELLFGGTNFDALLFLLSKLGSPYTTLDLSGTTITKFEDDDGPRLSSNFLDDTPRKKILSLALPGSVEIMGSGLFDGLFEDSLLQTITAPGLKFIEPAAFRNSALASVSLPEATYIERYAFYNTPLTSVYLPKVESIGDYAFGEAPLADIYIGALTPPALGVEPFGFDVRIQVPAEALEAYKAAQDWQAYVGLLVGNDTDLTPAAQLAADLNAIKAECATVEGVRVRLAGGENFGAVVGLDRNLTVPAGVTLDVTADGAALLLGKEAEGTPLNVTLTVNGTILAGSNYVRFEDNEWEATINGSGTIRLVGAGNLLNVGANWNMEYQKLTLDGVTLVGSQENTDRAVVSVSKGGQLVMKSGTITGNGGFGVLVEEGGYWEHPYQDVGNNYPFEGGIFTMEGGTISGNNGGVNINRSDDVNFGGGTFIMNSPAVAGPNGSIWDNTSPDRANVYNDGGTVKGTAITDEENTEGALW